MIKESAMPELRTSIAIGPMAIRVIQEAVAAVPQLGSVQTFLRADPKVRDAVFTLNAMGFTPQQVVALVAHDRYTLDVSLVILATSVFNVLKTISDNMK